ncbi:MAG: T9SS type A sorting domain-containing protein [Ignavibacteria bacterium]|nr:T9SS type A sorting domain-containing protein [Ignavibacteria bacterium]
MIYDILGNEIKRLIDSEFREAKGYDVIDGTNNSSGVYFYQLQANNFVQSKKMLLLK